MARPIKTGMDYFPHDTDACNDEKVEMLRLLYGNDGYAFYFIMLERVYRTPKGELKILTGFDENKNPIFDEDMVTILSKKILISPELFHKILKTCLKNKIFCEKTFEKNKSISSHGIKKRMKPILEKRRKAKGYNKPRKVVSTTETNPNCKEVAPETDIEKKRKKKEKERKEKERIREKKNMATEIIDILNNKTGKRFQQTEKNIGFIVARLNENKKLTIEDFEKVIVIKMEDPHFTKNNGKYLRPETLFGNKFDGYLNECIGSIQSQDKGMKKDGFTKEYYEGNKDSAPGNFEDLC
ncbi:MAG: DUF4373 domain-containing protein [archaeon]|nr:DUF4373 domain-containing protein [archaeon]